MLRVYKNDIIAVVSLLLILVAGFFINYGHWGDIIVDSGREAYIPQAMINGEVLYKDILNWYGPLSYQFNAILYKIFGSSLNLLYLAGLINTSIIVTCVYKLSRFFLTPFISFCICFFMIVYNVYASITVIHFIFPYAYAYVYAYSAFLISLICFLQFIQNQNSSKFLYLSFFFLGLSFANKAEFMLTIIPYILVLFTIKPKIPIKNIFLSTLFFLIVPALSYSIVFLQGATLTDILKTIKLASTLVTTPAYKTFSGLNLQIIPHCSFFFALLFMAYFPLYYIVFKCFKKRSNIIFTILLFILGIALFKFYNRILINITVLSLVKQLGIFCWIPFTTILIIGFLIYKIIKNFNQKDLMFLIFSTAVFLSVVKSHFILAFNTYGNYTIALFVLVHVIFLLNYIPNSKNLNKKLLISIFLICFSINSYFVYHTIYHVALKRYLFSTTKGKIYGDLSSVYLTQKIINYIEKNTEKNAKILVIPEGLMVNYITDRKSDMKLYSLTDIHIQTYGEQNVINMLKNSSPDYIFLHMPLKEGKFLNEFIIKNYKIMETFTNPNYDKEKYAVIVFKNTKVNKN